MNNHMNKPFSALGWSITAGALVLLSGCYQPTEAVVVPQRTEAGVANITDADVTTNVKMALMNDPVLSAFDIQIITTKGDVRLIGVVDSQQQMDAVIKLAEDAEGTHAIHNELTIKA